MTLLKDLGHVKYIRTTNDKVYAETQRGLQQVSEEELQRLQSAGVFDGGAVDGSGVSADPAPAVPA